VFIKKRCIILAMVITFIFGCALARAGDFSLNRHQGNLISISDDLLTFADASGFSINSIALSPGTGHAFLSEEGAYAAVFTYYKDIFPIKSAITVYDCSGNPVYSLNDIVATGGYLSQTGSLLTVGYAGEGPQAPAELKLFSAEGKLVASWEIPTFKAAYFDADGSKLLVLSPTEGSLVYDALSGELIDTLANATLGALNRSHAYLVSKDRLLVYRNGSEVVDTPSGIDFPRALAFEPGTGNLLVAGKDKLALFGDIQSNWTLPDAGFSITSMSATADLQKIAVGASDRQGNGLVYLLDDNLSPIKTIPVTLSKINAKIPQVAIAEDGIIWVNVGDQLVQF
jgi:hypothetical protein